MRPSGGGWSCGHGQGGSGRQAQGPMGYPPGGRPRPLNWRRPQARQGLWPAGQPAPCHGHFLATGLGRSAAAVQSLLSELFWDSPLSRAPGAGAGKGRPCRDPRHESASSAMLGCQGWATLGPAGHQERAPGLARCVTLGTACDFTCNSKAVTSLSRQSPVKGPAHSGEY